MDLRRALVTVAALTGLLGGTASGALAAPQGDVRLGKTAGSDMDEVMTHTGPERRAWFRRHYGRMIGYAPGFNRRLSWFEDAWAYQDLYAVYSDRREDGSRLRWVLKDSAGRRLFIPWGCNGRTCPQYAADPGDPGFRRDWIADARGKLRAGYRGLYVDDASLAMYVSDASGRRLAPIDPRTDAPMRTEDWRRYVAEFLEQIRRAFPQVEIVHNSLWWVLPLQDPIHRRQVLAADWLVLEHAFSDAGLTGGSGSVSFATYMRHMDGLHRMGRRILLDGDGSTPAARELLLAGYLMVNDGGDLLSASDGTDPGGLWAGFTKNLGRARGDRYRWQGVWRRDFERGTALLSEPDDPPRSLPVRGRRISGERVTDVTLGDRDGAVILQAG
jgi:hypothetical protein